MLTEKFPINDINFLIKIFLENAKDLIIVLDPNCNYNIDWINKGPLKEKLGYSRKKCIKKSFFDMIHPDDIERVKNFF